jgi:hypothetical protein
MATPASPLVVSSGSAGVPPVLFPVRSRYVSPMRRWLLLLLLGAASCFPAAYERAIAAHLDVMASMAEKLCAMATDGRAPRSEGMGEFIYPAKRARQFAEYWKERADTPSYALFVQAVDHYERLIDRTERARLDEDSWRGSARAICADRTAVRGLLRRARQAVDEENAR